MPTAASYQKLIIAALSAADLDAQADLQMRVPVFWGLYSLKAAMPDLRYWYTYRETVKMLMGRNARQIDQTRRNSLSMGQQNNDVVSDGSTIADADSSSRELGSSATARHKQSSETGLTTSSGVDNFTMSDRTVDTVNFYDVGSGVGVTNTVAHKNMVATRNRYTLNDSLVKGTVDASDSVKRNLFTRLTDSQQGFTHQTSLLGGTFGVVGTTHRLIADYGSAITQTDTTGLHIYNRVGGLQVDVASVSDSDSSLSANRNFTANVFDGVSSTRTGGTTGTTSSSRNIDNDLIGSGSMTHAARHEIRGLALSTTQTQDLTTGSSAALETSQANMLMQKLQQRYTHLKELFDMATRQIAMRERQAVPAQRHVVLEMTAKAPDSPDSSSNIVMNPCLPFLAVNR